MDALPCQDPNTHTAYDLVSPMSCRPGLLVPYFLESPGWGQRERTQVIWCFLLGNCCRELHFLTWKPFLEPLLSPHSVRGSCICLETADFCPTSSKHLCPRRPHLITMRLGTKKGVFETNFLSSQDLHWLSVLN